MAMTVPGLVKPRPVIVTTVPIGPLAGVKSVMLGGMLVGKTKGIALVAVPPRFVTVIGPVALHGTNTSMVVSERIVGGPADIPLKATSVVVVKPMPVIVTRVSKLQSPLRGLNRLMVGGASEFCTTKAAPGSKVPALGTPVVVDGFKTVSAAPGSRVPVLGKPGAVNGFSTVKLLAGSRAP